MDMKRANEMSGWTDEQWWEWAAEAFMPTNLRRSIEACPDSVLCGDLGSIDWAVGRTNIYPSSQIVNIIDGIIDDMASMGATPWVHHIIHTPQFVLAACIGQWAIQKYVRSFLWAIECVICEQLYPGQHPDAAAYQDRYEQEVDKEAVTIAALLVEELERSEGFIFPVQLACPEEPKWHIEFQAFLREEEARWRDNT